MRKGYNIIYILCILGMAFFIIAIHGCKPGGKPLYKELKLQTGLTEYKSTEIPNVIDAKRIKNQVFAIGSDDSIWIIDKEKKTEKKIIKSGPGPDEIFNPSRLNLFGNTIWVNTFGSSKYVYCFSSAPEEPLVRRKAFAMQISCDDYKFISENLVAMTRVYWEDGLLRIYDFNTGKTRRYGKPTIIDMMNKFNISRASVPIVGKKAYICQSIVPGIQVISFEKENGDISAIELAPPFYTPHPGKYIKNKYDHEAHLKWMSSWTSVFDILSYDRWLLVIYKYGYDFKYCYELIDLGDIDHRYYINQTSSCIYDFKIEKNKVEFDVYDQSGEDILWKKQDAYLY